MEPIDAELLPDESESAALARVERREVARTAPAAMIEVDAPGGPVLVPVTEAEYGDLKADQLYVGFYNKSGQVPESHEFGGYDWRSDPDAPYHLRHPPERKLLQPDNSQPFKVVERCGLAPLHRKDSWRLGGRQDASQVYSARACIVATSYITHFAVGTRSRGIIMAGAFHDPIRMLAGNVLQFGVRLPAQSAPPAELPAAQIDWGRQERAKELRRGRRIKAAQRRIEGLKKK